MNTICAFEFSVKAFLTYEIRNALNGLDPLYSNTPAIVNKSGNLRRTANSIHMNLLSRLCMIADELSSRLEVLTVKPNLALFAEVQEFFDRIIYSPEAKQEWRNFFAEKSGILWGEEIKKQQNAGLLCQEWIDMVNELAKGNRSDNFVLNNFN